MNHKCKFCSLIFDIEEVPDFNCIVKGSTSQFYINVPAGDPYDGGYLEDVKYCPYCGRDLKGE